MKAFGFLSFGHYAFGGQRGPSAEKMAKIHLELAQAADEIGVNNASFRVHHFVPQPRGSTRLRCGWPRTAIQTP